MASPSAAVVAAARARPFVGLRRDPDAYRAVLARAKAVGPVRNARHAAWLMMPVAETQDQEVAWMLTLDTHGFMRGVHEVARAQRDRVSFMLPDAFRPAIVDGSRYLVLFHNHPSGFARPSSADARLTSYVARGASYVDLMLLDHVVLGQDWAYSFRERQLWRVQ